MARFIKSKGNQVSKSRGESVHWKQQQKIVQRSQVFPFRRLGHFFWLIHFHPPAIGSWSGLSLSLPEKKQKKVQRACYLHERPHGSHTRALEISVMIIIPLDLIRSRLEIVDHPIYLSLCVNGNDRPVLCVDRKTFTRTSTRSEWTTFIKRCLVCGTTAVVNLDGRKWFCVLFFTRLPNLLQSKCLKLSMQRGRTGHNHFFFENLLFWVYASRGSTAKADCQPVLFTKEYHGRLFRPISLCSSSMLSTFLWKSGRNRGLASTGSPDEDIYMQQTTTTLVVVVDS